MKRPGQEMRRVAYGGLTTPSNINSWRYAREEGDKFTVPQINAMRRLGIDPAAADVIEVRSPATVREYWWPESEHAPVFILECPIAGEPQRDGRVKVISPAGHEKLVYPDGAITRAKNGRRR